MAAGLICFAVESGIDIFTIGQYLRPSIKHAEIKKYYHPDEFREFGEIGRNIGLRWVFSGPLVRSSYHAEDVFDQMMSRRRYQPSARRAKATSHGIPIRSFAFRPVYRLLRPIGEQCRALTCLPPVWPPHFPSFA